MLAAFPEKLSTHAEGHLARLGVEVRTHVAVTAIDAEGVEAGGARIRARTVLGGRRPGARLARTLGVTLDRTGRIAVMPDLSIPGAPDAFAAGDIVHLEVPGGGLVPGPAPAAIQTGRAAAESILVSVQGGSRMAFHYRGQAAHGHNR